MVIYIYMYCFVYTYALSIMIGLYVLILCYMPSHLTQELHLWIVSSYTKESRLTDFLQVNGWEIGYAKNKSVGIYIYIYIYMYIYIYHLCMVAEARYHKGLHVSTTGSKCCSKNSDSRTKSGTNRRHIEHSVRKQLISI